MIAYSCDRCEETIDDNPNVFQVEYDLGFITEDNKDSFEQTDDGDYVLHLCDGCWAELSDFMKGGEVKP